MTKDMTNGDVMKKIISFAFPVFLASLLQQLYNMADSIIVGRFVGKDAFAAVGSTGSLNFLIIGFILGLCTGVTVPVAQRFGAGDMVQMRRKIVAAIYVCLLLGVVLTLITTMGTGTLLHIMQSPENIYQDAYQYIFIIFLGIPATILYNLPANISRALGDSKTPLYFLILSAGLNVILDLVFVCAFHMGVRGTATATVISQAISGICCVIYMKRKYDILVFSKEDWAVDIHSMENSVGIGAPMGLQFSITAIGSVILQSAVNTLGSDTVAAVTAAMKVQMIAVQPMDALGVTMATYAGQNLGAGKIKRVREGVSKANIACIGGAVIAFLFCNFCAAPMTLLFIRSNEMNDTIRNCIHQILLTNSLFFIPLGTLGVFRNAVQGLGHSFVAMGAGVLELLGRSVVAFAAVGTFGFTAICFASPAAWIGANAILIPMYLSIMKKLESAYQKKKTEEKNEIENDRKTERKLKKSVNFS